MDVNEYPEVLEEEEQKVLNDLISKMDRVINSLDQQMRQYVREAHDADISLNPDMHLSHLLAQKGIKDTKENRKKFLQARDELYEHRLLLQYKDKAGKGFNEIKVGLHSCSHDAENFVISW